MKHLEDLACRVAVRHLTKAFDGDRPAVLAAGSGTPEERLLRARLERIAAMARRLLNEARVQPQKPASAFVDLLVTIVDQAEYE